jgi:site-specific DNA-adenine methylase
MHGEYNVKFGNAQQAKAIHNYHRIKEKLHRTKHSSSRFNTECEPTIIVDVQSVFIYFVPPDDD